ncbi:MAG: sulfatase activating formylglycine-generating enzyme [Myxococcota bacterium]
MDGRPFPWGWEHDPSWACTAESHGGAPAPHPVTAFPPDESPYGVRGLTGGIRDWCFNAFEPAGPAVVDQRAVVAGPADGSGPRITRGGAWSLPDWVGRICCRGFHAPIRLPDLGMRLARPYRR